MPKDLDTSCRVQGGREDRAQEAEGKDTCSLHPYQTFCSYFRLIFQLLILLSSSFRLVKLCKFHSVFKKQVVEVYTVTHFQNFDSLKEVEALTQEASSKEEGKGSYLDAYRLEAVEDKETCEVAAYDEASYAQVDTYKEDNSAILGKDQAYSACPAGCYPLWRSFVCHFRKFLFLFIFYRTYSFTSLFLYHVRSRYGGVYLIYDLICGSFSLIRESTHFTYDSDCALQSKIRYLGVSIEVRWVAIVGVALVEDVVIR